ncbi:MAG TPA: glycoside hydrolase family 125 protein [Candidatus Rubrimentiphilum sp.]|nr:glycoside hydrolase family 125 protein [Candidatus Rubrimentiphilum sp.]
MAVVLALQSTPARAQSLIVPLTGNRSRTIAPASLFHTLFSDFFSERDGTTYVQTGDIPAMWLRDSSAQTIPYVRFISAYPILSVRFLGVIERNARNIATDPYANAFTADYHIWERKWEADSPAWPVLLAWIFRRQSSTRALFTQAFHHALRTSVDTWRCEQLHATCSRYHLHLQDEPFNRDTGMVWTAYRPSDDEVRYHFNIPQEAIVAIALQAVAALAIDGYGDHNLANEARSMAGEIERGIQLYGRVWRPELGGWVYAYETDGLGNQLLADDANLPNLTSLPYLGWSSATDPVYLNTRGLALSSANPWYYRGTYASGLGSEHTPAGYVWPLGIIARALTATSSRETSASITTLAETDSRDGLIHESFDANAYWVFTRAEFGWANALGAELLFRSLAGFSATPFTTDGTIISPFEHLSPTPTLVSPMVQIYNASLLYGALNQLLIEANGRTILPGAPGIVMNQSAGSVRHKR